MPHLRKPMRDLYRETNPFEPVAPPATVGPLLQDFASLFSLAAIVIAAALVAVAYLPVDQVDV